MELTPPANTDIATRKNQEHSQALMKANVAHSQALMKADIGRTESRMQTYVWEVVVGTGVALYLALAATMLAEFQFHS